MEAKEKNAPSDTGTTHPKKSKTDKAIALPYMQNRELSWLNFNKRWSKRSSATTRRS